MTDETLPKGGEPDLTKLTAADVRFCLRLMQGETKRGAYIAEYGALATDGATRAAASRLVTNVNIAALLDRLREVAMEAAQVTVDDLVAWNRDVMYADFRRFLDATGKWLPPQDWPAELVALLDSVEFEEYTENRQKKIRPRKIKWSPKGTAVTRLMQWKKMIGPDAAEPDKGPPPPLTAQGVDLEEL